MAVLLMRRLRADSLKDIALQFHMEKYSSVSSIIRRAEKQMLTNRSLKKRVDMVADKARKGQEQTPFLTPFLTPFPSKQTANR